MSDKMGEALADLEANLTRQADCIARRDTAVLRAALTEAARDIEQIAAALSQNPSGIAPFEDRIRAAIVAANTLEQQAAATLLDVRASLTETARLRSGYQALGAALRTRTEGGGLLNQKR